MGKTQRSTSFSEASLFLYRLIVVMYLSEDRGPVLCFRAQRFGWVILAFWWPSPPRPPPLQQQQGWYHEPALFYVDRVLYRDWIIKGVLGFLSLPLFSLTLLCISHSLFSLLSLPLSLQCSSQRQSFLSVHADLWAMESASTILTVREVHTPFHLPEHILNFKKIIIIKKINSWLTSFTEYSACIFPSGMMVNSYTFLQ